MIFLQTCLYYLHIAQNNLPELFALLDALLIRGASYFYNGVHALSHFNRICCVSSFTHFT